DTKPNNVTSTRLRCGNAGAPMAIDCHRAATKPFGSIAQQVFAPLTAWFPALLMSVMAKARFKPPRNVIGSGSSFLHPFWHAPGTGGAGYRLARHFFQVGERRVDRAGAGLAGVFDDAVEPAVDKENRALARLTIVAVGVACGEADAT